MVDYRDLPLSGRLTGRWYRESLHNLQRTSRGSEHNGGNAVPYIAISHGDVRVMECKEQGSTLQ